MISDGPLNCPPDETASAGRISFASQYPYLAGVHHLRLSLAQFVSPSSWKFVGIVSTGPRLQSIDDPVCLNRSSFGWHLGRPSIVYYRHTSMIYGYDDRHVSQGDILSTQIDCSGKTITMKNERTLDSHTIVVNSQLCPLPWLFAVNLNYGKKDSMRLFSLVTDSSCSSFYFDQIDERSRLPSNSQIYQTYWLVILLQRNPFSLSDYVCWILDELWFGI